MIAHEIVAYVAGYIALFTANTIENGEMPQIPSDHRSRLKSFLSNAERLAEGILTITARWLVENIENEDIQINHIASEVFRVWGSRPPSFSEVYMFLKGYFDIVGNSHFTVQQTGILISELDRSDTGMPLRFQRLYFELTDFMNESGSNVDRSIDLTNLRAAVLNNETSFPSLAEDNADKSNDGKLKADVIIQPQSNKKENSDDKGSNTAANKKENSDNKGSNTAANKKENSDDKRSYTAANKKENSDDKGSNTAAKKKEISDDKGSNTDVNKKDKNSRKEDSNNGIDVSVPKIEDASKKEVSKADDNKKEDAKKEESKQKHEEDSVSLLKAQEGKTKKKNIQK